MWKGLTYRDWAVSAHHATWPPANLQASERAERSPSYPQDYVGLREGYIKPAEVAWYASHHHTPQGLNQPYAYSYIFAYAMDVPKGATTLTLPSNEHVRVLAISVAKTGPDVTPAEPLFDHAAARDGADGHAVASFPGGRRT